MKYKKHGAKEIIQFYLNNVFSSNLFARNFSENIFLNISNKFNSSFLILKVLAGNFKLQTHSEWLIIFIKRPIFFFLPKYQKSNSIKLIETIIEFSSCSNNKIFQLFEEILKIFFVQKNKNKNFENFILSKLFKTIEEKLIRKKFSNFINSILSILLLFVSNSSREFKIKFFDYFCWVLSEFLLKIADLHLIYLGEHQIRCLLLVENIFDQFKNEFSNRNISYSIILDILIVISNFYFSTVYPNLYKKLFWKTIGKFENKFFLSIQNFEKERVTFFPILLGFFFLDHRTKFCYINCSKILLLIFIFLSNNFKRILDCKESIKQISLIFQNLLLIKNYHSDSFVPDFKFFSIEEKFNHRSKKFYVSQILNSIQLKKKVVILYPKFIDFIRYLFVKNCNLFNKMSILFLITVKKGTTLKGVIINKYNKEIKKEVFKITESKLNKNYEKEISHIIDFFSGYRYQIPIKRLFDIVKIIFQKKIENYRIKAHVFNFFERILGVRGNDGKGNQLLDFNFDNLKQKINIKNLAVINLNDLNKSRGLFSKFFMRIIGQSNLTSNLGNTLDTNLMCKILKEIDFENCNFQTKVFLIEAIFSIIKNSKNLSIEFTLLIGNFGYSIIFKNQFENIPHVFEILAELIVKPKGKFLHKLSYNLFLRICNPHVWYTPILVESLISFTHSFVLSFSSLLSIENIVDILKILTFIYKKNKNQISFKLINILNILPNHISFLPHAYEIFSTIEHSMKYQERQSVLVLFVITNLFQNNFSLVKRITDKLKINSLMLLIDQIYKKCFYFPILNEMIFLYKNKWPIQKPEFKKIQKFIVRNCVNFTWELEKLLEKNSFESRSFSRLNINEMDIPRFKKITIFFNQICSCLI